MMTERRFHVYLLASGNHGTLYLGITSNLPDRIHQHKSHVFPGFSARYGVDRLVWYQEHQTALEAIECEKKMKKWRRDWKIKVIEEMNPDWSDLYPTLA